MKFCLSLLLICCFWNLLAQKDDYYYDYEVDRRFLDCNMPDDLDELDAFEQAYEKASKDTILSLMTLGDPDHFSNCDYYSYEYWGVKLIPIGDIIGTGMRGQVQGHNCFMKAKIREELGEKMDSLGTFPKGIRNIEEEIMKPLHKAIQIELVKADSLCLKIKSDEFSFLYNSTIIKEGRSKRTYKLGALEKGLIVAPTIKRSGSYYLVVLNVEIGDLGKNEIWCGNKKWNWPFKLSIN